MAIFTSSKLLWAGLATASLTIVGIAVLPAFGQPARGQRMHQQQQLTCPHCGGDSSGLQQQDFWGDRIQQRPRGQRGFQQPQPGMRGFQQNHMQQGPQGQMMPPPPGPGQFGPPPRFDQGRRDGFGPPPQFDQQRPGPGGHQMFAPGQPGPQGRFDQDRRGGFGPQDQFGKNRRGDAGPQNRFNQGRQGDNGPRGRFDQGRPGPGGPGMAGPDGAQRAPLLRTLFQDVNLDEQQRAAVLDIARAFRTEMQAWRETNEAQLRELMAEGRDARELQDTDKLQALMAEFRELRESAPNLMDNLEKVRDLLSDEQAQVFDNNLEKVRSEVERKLERPQRGDNPQGQRGDRPDRGRRGMPPRSDSTNPQSGDMSNENTGSGDQLDL